MTPEQLREMGRQIAAGEMRLTDDEAHTLFYDHADALEELARLCARLEIDCATDGNGNRVSFPKNGPDGIACRDETIGLLEAALDESERKIERLKALLHSLHALVWGECPSLLNEDSGGSGHLDADIRAEFKEE